MKATTYSESSFELNPWDKKCVLLAVVVCSAITSKDAQKGINESRVWADGQAAFKSKTHKLVGVLKVKLRGLMIMLQEPHDWGHSGENNRCQGSLTHPG